MSAAVSLPVVNPGAGIDYRLFLNCVHCGLCLNACPTYEVLGTEQNSPRGRIYIMRAATDGTAPLDESSKRALDLCLDCRACETACPSGVQYHKLIEPFRAALAKQAPEPAVPWLQRQVLKHLFPFASRSRLALAPARALQWTGLDALLQKSGLLRLLPKSLQQMHGMLPGLKKHHGGLPEVLPAEGKKRARVGLFLGCVADAVYPETNLATARVLQRNGCEVVVPRGQGCCGALPFHTGDEPAARRFAAANAAAFPPDLDAVVVNAAGCGAMFKEYGEHFADDPALMKLSAKVKDVHEFLMQLGPVTPTHPLPITATYHDACHLKHGQRIEHEPRDLLALIPELTLVPLPETDLCCGAAGSYNLTQPEMADVLGKRKADRILATGAAAAFAGNVGCLLQIARHVRERSPQFWIAHPLDALWASYSGEYPASPSAMSTTRS